MGAFRKNLLLQIGPIQTTVNLLTVVPKSDKPEAKMVCPDHLIPLKQQYECRPTDGDNHVVPWMTWDKAVETPKGWRKVSVDAKPTMDEASQVMELTPVSARVLADHTFTGQAIYWIEPSNEASAMNWTILVRQMKSGKTTFVTRGGFRKGGIEKLWKLELFQGHPVLREIVFPDVITDHPDVNDMSIDKDTQTLVGQFIQSRMTDWEDIDTTDRFKAALEEWVASGDLVNVKETHDTDGTGEVKQPHETMMAQLAEAVKKTKG